MSKPKRVTASALRDWLLSEAKGHAFSARWYETDRPPYHRAEPERAAREREEQAFFLEAAELVGKLVKQKRATRG